MRSKRRPAFTLIELLIVIAIIAILALIAIPNFLEAQTRSKVSRAQADMRSIAAALESYFVDHNTYPVFQNIESPWSEDFYRTYPNPYGWFLWIESHDPTDWYHKLRLLGLTTPIPYMTTRPPNDPFGVLTGPGHTTARGAENISYYYYNFLAAAQARHYAGSNWHEASGATPGAEVVAPAPLRFNGSTRIFQSHWALVSPGPSRDVDLVDPDDGGKVVAIRNMLNQARGWDQMMAGKIMTYDPTNGTVSAGGIWRMNSGSMP